MWLLGYRDETNLRNCGQVSVLGSISSAEDCSSLKFSDPKEICKEQPIMQLTLNLRWVTSLFRFLSTSYEIYLLHNLFDGHN